MARLEILDRRLLMSITASIAAPNIEVNGGTSGEFGIIFSSGTTIDPTTLKQGDITISGPRGTIIPRLVKVNPASTPDRSVTAVFTFTPPDGKWEMVDDGTYNFLIAANTLKDTGGNAIAPGKIGSFDCNILPAFELDNGTLLVNGTAGADTISITRPDININVTENGATTLFDGDTVKKISVVGGTSSESVTLSDVITATVIGTNGNDTVFASSAGDSILGMGGNDLLVGGAGNDTLGGAGGDDTLLGGGGKDSIRGGKGDDLIRGGAGNDTLVGGQGNNSIGGGLGDDQIFALNSAADTVTGGAGSDTVHADTGMDSITSATQVLNS